MPHSRTLHAEAHERLAKLIQRDNALLVERWARRTAEEQPAARRMHHEALLDHVPAFLDALASSLAAAEEEQALQHRLPAFRHGDQRWQAGWSLPEVVRDYQILRTVLMEYFDATCNRPLHLHELLALNLAFDEAIAASVGMYVADRDEAVREAERSLVERQKQAETDRLQQQTDMLREVDRRKDEFLAVLGHELRNPLAPIRNVVQAFKLKPPDAATVQWATAIVERQVRHMTRLVDDLLDITRIGRGRVQLRLERLDFAALVRVALEDQRAALEAAQLTVALDVPPREFWVNADAVRLTQVVHNLLHNAMKFTPAGGRVTVRLQRDPDRPWAVLTVIDSGVGIEPSELPHLFETFRQAERSRHQSQGGLGLGLALVKGLVELHGGMVRAASAGLGHGAEFTISLPLADEPAALT